MNIVHAKRFSLLLSAAFLAACSGQKTIDEAPVVADTPEPVAIETPAPVVEVPAVDPASLVGTIYFDFDDASIKWEGRDDLMAHAKLLASDTNLKVTLEGHADERGTVEYNLALGERRAQGVANFLMANGASRYQVETVSYGEEQPVAFGTNESSWSLNRRVEIKY